MEGELEEVRGKGASFCAAAASVASAVAVAAAASVSSLAFDIVLGFEKGGGLGAGAKLDRFGSSASALRFLLAGVWRARGGGAAAAAGAEVLVVARVFSAAAAAAAAEAAERVRRAPLFSLSAMVAPSLLLRSLLLWTLRWFKMGKN